MMDERRFNNYQAWNRYIITFMDEATRVSEVSKELITTSTGANIAEWSGAYGLVFESRDKTRLLNKLVRW